MQIKVKYHIDKYGPLQPIEINPNGDWIDLRAAKDMRLWPRMHYLIPLGISMELPDGYEAHIAPRSSAFKKWGILEANSVGIIDNSYCGDDDEWMMSVYATDITEIHKGDRICQFRIVQKQPQIEFLEVDYLENKSRGGFGSTGVN